MTHKQLGYGLTLSAVVVAGLGVGFYTYLNVGATAPTITTATVTRGDIVQVVAATGTLEAVTTVQVGTQVSGTVRDLLADFNDIVRKGQVLARLDPSLLQAQVEQASASLAKAEADAEKTKVALDDARVKRQRSTTLSERSLISVTDMDAATMAVRSAEAQAKSADAQVTQARAALNQARLNVDHTVITSPIDGIVIARNVDAGQTVAASMSAPTLFILAADLSRMRVNAKLDESDMAHVKEGLGVTFRVDAYPGETFTGRVAQVRLQGEVVSNVVTYTALIDVPNTELKLKPGMTANVTVEVARSEDVLRVPSVALRFRPTTGQLTSLGAKAAARSSAQADRTMRMATVWRYVGTTLEPVEVKTGITDGSMTELVSGALRVNDHLVTMLVTDATASAKANTATSSSTKNPLISTGMPGPPPGGPR